MIEWVSVYCPYCGEQFDIAVDCSAGDQIYTEDCFVCCNPILFKTNVDPDGRLQSLETKQENE